MQLWNFKATAFYEIRKTSLNFSRLKFKQYLTFQDFKSPLKIKQAAHSDRQTISRYFCSKLLPQKTLLELERRKPFPFLFSRCVIIHYIQPNSEQIIEGKLKTMSIKAVFVGETLTTLTLAHDNHQLPRVFCRYQFTISRER